ncbi:MAG TPA: LLM class F420-dependent oxidoreductase [Acidimicrobiia bacterium]|nr:LLM class F420-dependent oxidoreductase [Acidimicrobiia bacterium]
MKLGLMFANTLAVTREQVFEMAGSAEEAGYESLWTVDHVVVPKGYESTYPYSRSGRMAGGVEDLDFPDPLIWLAFAAAASTSLRLATGVLVLPQRNPVLLAKQVATLDRISDGRVILGVGSGWLEEEFDALGASFEDRGERADEYIRALRALWSQEVASFDGEFVRVEDVYVRPQPARGSIPIVIGGHSKRAARRAGQLGDGFYPASTTLEDLPVLVAHAREWAERSERDPEALEITMAARPDVESVERLAAMGVDRVVVAAAAGPEALASLASAILG